MIQKEGRAVLVLVLLGLVALGAAGWAVLADPPVPVDVEVDVGDSVATGEPSDVDDAAGDRGAPVDRPRTIRGADLVARPGDSMDRGAPDPSDDDVLTASYEELKGLLDRRDWRQLQSVVDRSKIVDQRIVEELIKLLSHPKDRYLAKAVLELVRNANHIEMLSDAYRASDDTAVKGLAMDAMAISGGKSALPALLGYLDTESNEGLIRQAARSVSLVGDAEAVNGLVHALERNLSRPVESGITHALGQVRDPEGVQRIVAALDKAEHPAMKLALIESLEIAKQPASVPALSRLAVVDDDTTHDEREVAHRAVAALGAVGDESATRRLLDLAEQEGPLRAEAFAALQNSRARTLGNEFVERLDATQDEEYRAGLMMAIGRTGDKGLTGRLLLAAESEPTTDGRRTAVRALGEMKDAAAIPALKYILEDGSAHDNLKFEVISSIGRIGDRTGIPVLEKAAADDGLPASVQHNAKRQLLILRARVDNPSPR